MPVCGGSTKRLTLKGFWCRKFNQDYIKSSRCWFDGEPTFWSTDGSMFLHCTWRNDWISGPLGLFRAKAWASPFPEDQLLAVSFNDGYRFGAVDWYEGTEFGFEPNEAASIDGDSQLHVERGKSLLTIMPGAKELQRDLRQGEDSELLEPICRALARLPADGGAFWASLKKSRHPLDRQFATWCVQAQERARAEAEQLAEVASAELIAEEEMERARSKKKAAKKAAKMAKAKSMKACPAQLSMSGSENEAVPTEREELKAVQFDISPDVLTLRHNFPMFDDDVLGEHLMQAAYDLEEAVLSLSKLQAEPGVEIEPVDIPCKPASCQKYSGQVCNYVVY